MGYNTEYIGEMVANKPFDKETVKLLNGLFTTRRMRRRGLDTEKYGVEGEFYFEDDHNVFKGQIGVGVDTNKNDHNTPPKTQPHLWCDMEIGDDNKSIEWNGAEKTYCFKEWLEYIINILGEEYEFNGEFDFQGEDTIDMGTLIIESNIIVEAL